LILGGTILTVDILNTSSDGGSWSWAETIQHGLTISQRLKRVLHMNDWHTQLATKTTLLYFLSFFLSLSDNILFDLIIVVLYSTPIMKGKENSNIFIINIRIITKVCVVFYLKKRPNALLLHHSILFICIIVLEYYNSTSDEHVKLVLLYYYYYYYFKNKEKKARSKWFIIT
jgi:hypothetical protein